jgi:hypothetical protein
MKPKIKSATYETLKDCLAHKKIKSRGYEIKFYTLFTLKDATKELIYNTDKDELIECKFNTLEYIYSNHEGGALYLEIRNNEINKVCALGNAIFKNHWHQYLKKINIKEYNKNKQLVWGRFRDKDAPINTWTKNGCLINRCDYHSIFNSYQNELVNSIEQTLHLHKIRDTEFILWTKDFPLLRKDGIDEYIPQYKQKIHNGTYLPIYSQSTTANHADIPLLNSDEWKMISKKYFATSCNFDKIDDIIDYAWDTKIEKGFFRGRATGCFADERNPRIKVNILSDKYPELLDAGCIEFVKRDKIENGELSYMVPKELKKIMKLKQQVPMNTFSKWKYILNIKGNGAPYRFPFLFFLKSLILHVESDFKLWFELYKIKDKLIFQPYIHYIPIKADLSDLIEKIEWCKANDAECKKIAHNSYKFGCKWFSEKETTKYIASMLNGNVLNPAPNNI